MDIEAIELSHAAKLLEIASDALYQAKKHDDLSGMHHIGEAQRYRERAAACKFAVTRILSRE